MEVIEKTYSNNQGEAGRKDMNCKEAAPDQVESNSELNVTRPLPPVQETVEGSHHMETYGNVIKGLPNRNNSCFFNVMLQSLLALDPLRCKMLGPDVWAGPLALSLNQLFLETSSSNVSPYSLDPKNLFKITCTRFPVFKSGKMEDCHELLRLFLDSLATEEAEIRQLENDTPSGEVKTIVNSIFRGCLSQTVSSIQCPHSSGRTDTFLDVSLAIPQGSLASIEDCWALYTEQTPLVGWECPDCTSAQNGDIVTGNAMEKVQKRNAMSRILIDRSPPVLVVTLKRFEYKRNIKASEKLSTKVCFTEMFDIQPYMKQRSPKIKTFYRLVAVVEHIGVVSSGHYVAYVKANKMGSQMQCTSDSKCWFYASDEDITEVSLNEVLRCEPCILFYERCLYDDSEISTNLTREESQLGDINTLPNSSANPTGEESQLGNVDLTCEESQLAGINMQPQTYTNPTFEESQLAENNMLPQIGASVSHLSAPLDEVQLWGYQRTRNRERRIRNEIAKGNDLLGQRIGFFLDRFILPGDIKPYYHCELVMMCERGSGSQELNIHYSHLVKYSKKLAMDVCNGYARLMMNLKEAAVRFVEKMLATLDLTDTARKRMQQLASVEPASSLELKFLNMPKIHRLLRHYLRHPFTIPMHVYGNRGKWNRIPVPEKCAMLQKLLAYMISCHRAGLSWNGDFNTDLVDVYEDRVFITKEPNSYSIYPQISLQMISAMENDFRRIAHDILTRFEYHGASIPYLKPFTDMLRAINKYADWWLDRDKAEALRKLIEHNPFLKPATARSNLWSGIFNAYRSHDEGDKSAIFKKLLKDGFPSDRCGEPWITRSFGNPILKTVFKHKDQKVPAQVTDPVTEKYYEESFNFLFEFQSHLVQHGSAYSFQSTQYGPRKQLMRSLNEAEVAAARVVEEEAMEGLTHLLRNDAMKGLLFDVWDCYKNCNYPYQPQRRH